MYDDADRRSIHQDVQQLIWSTTGVLTFIAIRRLSLRIRQVKPTKLKYLNEVSSRIPVLLRINKLNILIRVYCVKYAFWYIKRLCTVIYRSYKLVKIVQFFSHPVQLHDEWYRWVLLTPLPQSGSLTYGCKFVKIIKNSFFQW